MIVGILTGIIKGARDKRKADVATQKAQSAIDAQQSQLDAFMSREYYGDYMNRNDVQASLRRLREDIRRLNDKNRQTALIDGSTPEAVAATQENTARVLGNTYSNIAAGATSWRRKVLDNYIDHSMANSNRQYSHYARQASEYRAASNRFLMYGAEQSDKLVRDLVASSGIMQ